MTSSVNTSATDNNSLDLRRFFRSVKKLKWVYLASFILFTGLAVTYCCIKFPQYEVKATLLIEEPGNDTGTGLSAAGGMATMMRTFSIGGFGATSVNNELQLISSHDVLLKTAKALGLNRNYILRDGLGKEMLFLDSPIAIEAPQEMMDTLTKAMKIVVKIDGNKADITVKRGLLGRVIAEKKSATLPATLATPFGPVSVMKTDHYTGERQTIEATLLSYESAADYLYTEIDVDTPDKLSDAVSFSFLYPNRNRGRAILNTIMAEYNAKRLDRKHSTATAQLDFLNGRIAAVYDEIKNTDLKIEEFKDKYSTASLFTELPVLFESSAAARGEMVKSSAEVSYYKELLATLSSADSKDQLLPVFNAEAYPMVKDYNEMLMQKKELERSAKPDNPVLLQTEANLTDMRASITRNVENMLQGAQALVNQQKSLISKSESKLEAYPGAEREFNEISRDRIVIGELYSYLTSQRESAMLQLYNQDAPGFIVDEAYTAIKPSKKKAIIACAGCFLLALLCPSFLALWLTWRSRRLVDPMDAASAGLEGATMVIDDTKESINRLRSFIINRGSGFRIFVSGDASEAISRSLANSFKAIDRNAEILLPGDIGADNDNDSLLLPKFRDRAAEILARGGTEYLLITVPDSERVDELAPAVTAEADTILLLAYHPDILSLSTLESVRDTFGPDHIVIALDKSN